jgi:hypothetical protein
MELRLAGIGDCARCPGQFTQVVLARQPQPKPGCLDLQAEDRPHFG